MDKSKVNDLSQLDKCPCCFQYFGGPTYSLCGNSEKLAEYGLGIALYFSMQCKYLFVSCSFLIISIMAILSYYYQGMFPFFPGENLENAKTIGGPNDTLLWLRMISITNLRRSQSQYNLLLFSFFLLVIFLLGSLFMRKKLVAEDVRLQQEITTPANYTVSITGFDTSQEFNESEFLKEIIYKEFGENSLVRTIFIHDYSQFSNDMKILLEAKKEKAIIDKYRDSYDDWSSSRGKYLTPSDKQNIYPPKREGIFSCFQSGYRKYALLESIIDKYSKILEGYRLKNKHLLQRVPQLYISFYDLSNSSKLLEKYEVSDLQYLFGKSRKRINNNSIYFRKAPEPGDIIWENLPALFFRRLFGKLIVYFCSCLLLAGCFVANMYISKWQIYLVDSISNIFLQLLSCLGTTVLIMLTNYLFKLLMPVFCVLIKSHTITSYHFEVSSKLAIARFVNTAIIPIISRPISTHFSGYGILFTITFNWVFLAFTEPFLEFCNVPYLCYLIYKYIAMRKGEKSKLFQIEANKIFEPPYTYIPDKYAVSTTLMLYTSFYALYCPVMIFITIIGLIINYVVDKFVFFHFYKRPENLSGVITRRTFNLMIFFCSILICTSNIVFSIIYAEEISFWLIFISAIPMMALIIMVSIYLFFRYFIGSIALKAVIFNPKESIKDPHNLPYDLKKFAYYDYKKLYPLTSLEAQVEILKMESLDAKSEFIRSRINDKINVINEEMNMNMEQIGKNIIEENLRQPVYTIIEEKYKHIKINPFSVIIVNDLNQEPRYNFDIDQISQRSDLSNSLINASQDQSEKKNGFNTEKNSKENKENILKELKLNDNIIVCESIIIPNEKLKEVEQKPNTLTNI